MSLPQSCLPVLEGHCPLLHLILDQMVRSERSLLARAKQKELKERDGGVLSPLLLL